MAIFIQNSLHSKFIQVDQSLSMPSTQPLKFVQNLIRNSPFQKYEKTYRSINDSHRIRASIYFESAVSLQAVAEISFDLKLPAITMSMSILYKNYLLRMCSKDKTNALCRLLQKYNAHLTHHNALFYIHPHNGIVTIANTILTPHRRFSNEDLKQLHEIATANFYLVKEQVIYLIEYANQRFEWEIYARDSRYLEKVHSEMIESMKIRELIALSDICFQDEDTQNKYVKNKQLITFISNRESMVNLNLRKHCFIAGQMNLFSNFLEPFYFASNPLSLEKLETDFTKQFDPLFYKFTVRKMVNGDNPYLFNTILIKNESKVKLKSVGCEGGFSKIEIAEMEIAYTQSQNLVLDLPKLSSKSPKKSWVDDYQCQSKQKIEYFPKVIAIKVSKHEADYQKIKHEKVIVQNFRTTTSPFILKYYNCTQKGFKYRQYLLMDYLGPNLTLAEYNILHRGSLSLHSKLHIFIHLSNALTFLQKQQVVHMDLSSHNILICKDLLIKVIDFGEAYHPYLDKDKTIKYLPGHTMPYCPPETFNRIKKFTSKSDAFSLGVILYRTLFNDFPFTPSAELKESFMDRSYLERWMLAPERVGEYGYETQLLLLLQLISRCLSGEPSKRPNTYWLYVILNKIFLSLK